MNSKRLPIILNPALSSRWPFRVLSGPLAPSLCMRYLLDITQPASHALGLRLIDRLVLKSRPENPFRASK